MKRVAILLLLCAVWAVDLMAQEIVTGTVVDGKNEPVPGVRVEIDGRSEYAMTDIDGTFRIELPVTAKKVRVTYPGFKPIVRNIKPDMVIKLGNGWAGKSSGYRGFFDFLMGSGFGGEVNVEYGKYLIEDIRPGISFGFTTTHGYQINPHLYAGLGFGMIIGTTYAREYDYNTIYSTYETNMVSVPLYLDLRWDFGLTEKTAPYVGLKVGYKHNISTDEDWPSHRSGDLGIITDTSGQFFLQPSVGMRVRTGNKKGFNLGLSYSLMEKRKLRAVYDIRGLNGIYEDSRELDLGSATGGMIMLNIGFDF